MLKTKALLVLLLLVLVSIPAAAAEEPLATRVEELAEALVGPDLEAVDLFFAQQVEILDTGDHINALWEQYQVAVEDWDEWIRPTFTEMVEIYRVARRPDVDTTFFLWVWEDFAYSNPEQWDEVWEDVLETVPQDEWMDFLTEAEAEMFTEVADLLSLYYDDPNPDAFVDEALLVFKAFALSPFGWNDELNWVLSDVFWTDSGLYGVSDAGNLLVPGTLVVDIMYDESLELFPGEYLSVKDNETVIRFRKYDDEQEGLLLFRWSEVDGVYVISAADLSWSEEFAEGMELALEWIGQ